MKKYYRSDLEKESSISKNTIHWRLHHAGKELKEIGVPGKFGIMIDPDTGKYCVDEDNFRKYWTRTFRGGRLPKVLEKLNEKKKRKSK